MTVRLAPVPAALPLSVVVASTQPWPEARACLESLHDQAAAAGAEIVVAHRGGALPADVDERYPRVVSVVCPGASANELRAAALDRARGEVVAITEDHCRVTGGWCAGVIAAHREYPDAAAIGGAVENGTTRRAVDRASFFLTNAPAMLPLEDGEAEAIAAQANVSYKRRALPGRAPDGAFFELDHNAELRRRGERLVADSRLVVFHDQSLGLAGTCAIFFHASRAYGGWRGRQVGSLRRVALAALAPVLHPAGIVRHLRGVWRKGRARRQIAAAAPLMALLGACATAGLTLGFAAGEGDSARHIR